MKSVIYILNTNEEFGKAKSSFHTSFECLYLTLSTLRVLGFT